MLAVGAFCSSQHSRVIRAKPALGREMGNQQAEAGCESSPEVTSYRFATAHSFIRSTSPAAHAPGEGHTRV